MWRILGLFSGLFGSWWLLLWWGLPIQWQKMNPSPLLFLHVLPPLLLGVAWKVWQRVREKRLADSRAQAEATAEAERKAQQDAARAQHLAMLAERQRTAQCRGVWVRALPVQNEPAWLGESPQGCNWQMLQGDDLVSADDPDGIAGIVEDVLSGLYASLPGAAWLPVYCEAQLQREGLEQLEWFRNILQASIADQSFEVPPKKIEVRFLPGDGALAERVLQVLQQDPGLPGLVVLAADAPRLDCDPEESGEPATDPDMTRHWQGRPGAAIAALLFFRSGLPNPVQDETPAQSGVDDIYVPYWDKQQNGAEESWGAVPLPFRAALYDTPVLAELCLAERDMHTKEKIHARAEQVNALLERSLINAWLKDCPFSPEECDPQNNKGETISWLVHNSGDADVGGARLAAITMALNRQSAMLNPIDEASNSVREWGDVGCARHALHTALAVTHAARLAAPVVLADFAQPTFAAASSGGISIAIVRPMEAAS